MIYMTFGVGIRRARPSKLLQVGPRIDEAEMFLLTGALPTPPDHGEVASKLILEMQHHVTKMSSNRFSAALGHKFISKQFTKDFVYYGFAIVTWIPAAIFFNEHVGELTWIHGASMFPYLNTGYNQELTKDICWNNKWNPKEGLQRGMIISFRYV